MCGINGFNFRDERLIRQMNKISVHRGPDGTGVFLDEGISLGHNRLSIIDLSDSASQPMASYDGNLVITFNGEIYNFRELKKELADSYPFKTQSDTEVILASYKKFGKDCVKKFNGIFALAIWDKAQKELFLARDHGGVKPLYYFWDRHRFIFSSEIKSILEHDIPRVVNSAAFNHYLRVLYVPEPMTMFKGIYKFPPASRAVFKNGRLQIEKYWDAVSGTEAGYGGGSRREAAAELRRRVEKAVERQLVSDRPLGIYLSGGIDSSVVLDCVSRLRKNIDTFSVGFDLTAEEQKEKFNQDFYLARSTAKHYGTSHHEVLLSSQDVLDFWGKAIWHLDEPISNPTALPMMKLAEFAKKKVDVVLGGDGGDELFGGYERYRLSRIASYYQTFPQFLRKIFVKFSEKARKLDTPAGTERFALFMFQKDDILKRVVNTPFLLDGVMVKKFFADKYFGGSFGRKFEELFMDADRKSWLVDESLMMTDKMSMSAGLEARVPLLDKELVEFAARLPLKYKISSWHTKIILKEAFRDRIPSYIFRQPKRGWFSPGAKWLRHPRIYALVREVLSPSYCSDTASMFHWEAIDEILRKHQTKESYNLTILWALLTFQMWAKIYRAVPEKTLLAKFL